MPGRDPLTLPPAQDRTVTHPEAVGDLGVGRATSGEDTHRQGLFACGQIRTPRVAIQRALHGDPHRLALLRVEDVDPGLGPLERPEGVHVRRGELALVAPKPIAPVPAAKEISK